MTGLPEPQDIGLIAFRVDDEGDHPGGGHCVSLSQPESEGTIELVDQYLTALRLLVEYAAQSPDGGWALTHPLLFHAHHTAELAAKAVLLAGGVAFERQHGLATLWRKITGAGLDQGVAAVDAAWCGNFTSVIADVDEPLLFDHDQIVTAAITALRERYEIRYRYVDIHPDPDGFLPSPFTLHQLRRVHEAVVGAELHKDNFNRRMKPLLEPVLHKGEPVLSDGLRGRPAALYRPTDR